MTAMRAYGAVTWSEKASAVASLVFHLPLALTYALLTAPLHPPSAHKTWRRVLSDTFLNFLTRALSTVQLQWLNGDPLDVYKAWTQKNGMSALTEDVRPDSDSDSKSDSSSSSGSEGEGEGVGTRLLWIGRQRTDRVILYLHGGGYVLPMTDFGLTFWKRTVAELKARGVDTGFAIVNYTLLPTATFPTPLTQAALALNHLLASGARPENIQITGDSAGGNLALQLLSHILHPLPDVPPVKLSAPLGGMYLMSPWVDLSNSASASAPSLSPSSPSSESESRSQSKSVDSMEAYNTNDTTTARALAHWGAAVLRGVPEPLRAYAEPLRAPRGWWDGAGGAARRVLITGGEAECLADGIGEFARGFCGGAGRAGRGDGVANGNGKANGGGVGNGVGGKGGKTGERRFVVQKGGVHNDPFFDFLSGDAGDTVGSGKVGELTPVIWDWFVEGFSGAV